MDWMSQVPGRKGKIVLVVAGGIAGWGLFAVAPYPLLGAAAKTLAVFLGTVWVTVMAFALKLADITEAPSLTVEEHQRLEAKVRAAVRRVWLYAAGNAAAAVFVLLPSVMVDAKAPVYAWMVVLSGCAAGFAVYSVVAHAIWQEELRQFRSSLRERERREKALEALVAKMAQDHPVAEDDRSKMNSLNRVADWGTSTQPH